VFVLEKPDILPSGLAPAFYQQVGCLSKNFPKRSKNKIRKAKMQELLKTSGIVS
jgi:hypothetical protein